MGDLSYELEQAELAEALRKVLLNHVLLGVGVGSITSRDMGGDWSFAGKTQWKSLPLRET